MHNRSKLKEQEQSDRDDPSFDAEEQYESEQPNCKDRRGKGLVCKTVKQEFCLQNEDWLIRLVRLNASKMKHILEWIHSLLELIRESPQRYVQHINGLHFNEIQKNKGMYLLFMYRINEDYSSIKVRDVSGLTVSFKIFENEKKPSIIYEYLKKIGNKTSTFIFDHSEDNSYIKRFTNSYNTSNIIFVSKKPINYAPSSEEEGLYLKHSQNQYYYRQHKLAKKVNLQEIIEEYIDIEVSDSFAINQVLSFIYPKKNLTVEAECLLANIIKGLHPKANKETVLAFLQKGLDEINRHLQRWKDSAKDHFPGPSISKRSLCNFCKRKKSQAICKGCTYVYNEEIHLCIRTCFQRHHELQSTFMKKQTTDICKNINFFDGLCKDISGNLNSLIEEEAEQYLTFANYLHSKLMTSMNKLSVKQSAVEEDEAETND